MVDERAEKLPKVLDVSADDESSEDDSEALALSAIEDAAAEETDESDALVL